MARWRMVLGQPARRCGLVLGGLLLVSLPVGTRTAWAQYPAGAQVAKDGTAVLLQDYASLPLSSRTSGSYPPPINFAGQLGRVNFLRSEPASAPQSSSRFFVNDMNRNLYILDKSTKTFTPYVNFEEVFPKFDNDPGYAGGLVTLAFDPNYGDNGKFYTVHTEDPNKSGSAVPTNSNLPGLDLSGGYTTTTVVNPPAGTVVRQAVLVEWTDTNRNNSTFEGTAHEILRVGFNTNIHPMGDLLFNPLAQPGDADYRNLYIAVGDGGAGETFGDTHTIPQRLDALQGKILRITPDITLRIGDALSSNGRYRIPTTGSDPNPFASLSLSGLRKEIYAYGFRNPHRMSWDMISNKLIVDDIGLHSWEEVNIVTKEGNYGYAEREGIEQLFVSNDSNNGKTGSQTSPPTPFPDPDSLTVTGISTPVTPIYPVAEYSHEDGDAISSGFVYRGSLMPQLYGKYIFGDITTARLFYADLADMIANDDGNRTSLAAVHELQVVFDSPYDNPNQGPVNRRLFDIVADEYAHKGGDAPGSSVLPGVANATSGNDPDGIPYGGGRADIRLALGGDGEIYVLSKSDGMVRALVVVAPPTVETPPSANPNPVTGTATSLSVLGADDGGEANLTYMWSTTGTPPAPVSFSANGSNAAKTTNATFSKAGTYTFRVTITDTGGLSTTSSVIVTVNQTFSMVTVSPATATVYTGGAQQFSATAYDQFNNTMATQPTFTWAVTSGGGTVSSTGLFTAPSAAGTSVVTASSATVSGSATVTVSNLAAGCVQSGATWANVPIASQSGKFSIEFDATPNAAGMDGVTGLSNGPADAYTDLAAIVRFYTNNFIDARNGGSYSASASIPYTPGVTYHFRLVVDILAHRYTAYVKPAGQAEQLLASNFAFRTEQAAVSQLNHVGVRRQSGSHTVCNILVSAADAAPPVISAVAAGNVSSSSAIISWSTDESANSQVEYGISMAYGSQSTLDTALVTSHSVVLSGLSAGTLYHYRVKSADANGNLAVSGDFTFTTSPAAGTTPPETTITLAPPALTNSTAANFSFSADEPATFQCSLDGSTFASCTSPQNYSVLADGSHTFQVQATDSAGNADPTPASYTWTVDTAPPNTTITANPPALSNSSSASFSFTSSEPASSFQCRLDAALFTVCSSPKSYTGLLDGSHSFQVRATDPAGNADPTPASFSWIVDATAPAISNVGTKNIKKFRATITWATNEASNTQVEYGLTPSYGQTTILNTALVTSHSQNLTGLQPNTTYHYRVRSRDAAGNLAVSGNFTFTTAR